MREALMEVTSKFEFVVTEMREALRVTQSARRGGAERPSPSPSVASTAATDKEDRAALPNEAEQSFATTAGQTGSLDRSDHLDDSFEADRKADIPALMQLWTPPRGSADEPRSSGDSSPKKKLSLATSLPDTPNPAKALHLADHLEQ